MIKSLIYFKVSTQVGSLIRDHSFITYSKRWVGGCGQMLTFAYKVGGWVWQNAYVIIRITKKDQSELTERLHEMAIFKF